MATPTTAPPQTLVHAYRHLLRAALRAVQFSKPARYVVRDQIRQGFESASTPTKAASEYDAERVRRTIWFLKAAAQEAGLESKILKSLVRVAWERKRAAGSPVQSWKSVLAATRAREAKGLKGAKKTTRTTPLVTETAYDHYDRTVMMLNDTMGLCLR